MSVIVIRGPIAVGKTTVCQELSKLYDRVAVIPVDWLRHMIGRWSPESKSEAILAGRNAASLARNFCDAGYQVIVDGPFDNIEALSEFMENLADLQVFIVTLTASWDEVFRRHTQRPINQQADLKRVLEVHKRILCTQAHVQGVCIQTDGKSTDEVVSAVRPLINMDGSPRESNA